MKHLSMSLVCLTPSFCCTAFAGMVVWDITAKRYRSRYQFSILFEHCFRLAKYCWERLGVFTAYLGSYLTVIDLQEVYRAMYDIVRPVVNVLISFRYFVPSFCSTAEFLDKYGGWRVFLGVCLLGVATIWGFVRFRGDLGVAFLQY